MRTESEKTKLTELRWYDAVIISLILFGRAIWSSTMILLSTSQEILNQGTEFTSADNWYGIISIIIELFLSWVYLRLRNFDFSQWKYKPGLKGSVLAIGIYIVMCLGMDIVNIIFLGWSEATKYVGSLGIIYIFKQIDLSLLLFSFMNGIYEEIFFLGVCTSVIKKQRLPVIIYSLIVRFSFHTYQGIGAALGIGFVIGGLYLFFFYRSKDRNLYSCMLSHTFADIFGAGLLYLL